MSGLSRRRVLRGAAAGSLALGGGFAAARLAVPPRAEAGTSDADARILNFLLSLEDLQVAFFDRVAKNARFGGEAQQFAKTAARQDRAHAGELRSLLGAAAKPTSPHVEADPHDAAAFVQDALELKEAVVAAYIGEAANLTTPLITRVATIVSVEARHAAWIRSIATVIPAPRAADRSEKPVDVVRKLEGARIGKVG